MTTTTTTTTESREQSESEQLVERRGMLEKSVECIFES